MVPLSWQRVCASLTFFDTTNSQGVWERDGSMREGWEYGSGMGVWERERHRFLFLPIQQVCPFFGPFFLIRFFLYKERKVPFLLLSKESNFLRRGQKKGEREEEREKFLSCNYRNVRFVRKGKNRTISFLKRDSFMEKISPIPSPCPFLSLSSPFPSLPPYLSFIFSPSP